MTWYDAPAGGAVVPGATALASGTTYYASQIVLGCESSTRLAVTVTVDDPLSPSGAAAQSFCAVSLPDIDDIAVTATGTVTWYDAPAGGAVVPGATALASGTTYYASQTISGCESRTRLAVTVTLNAGPTATLTSSDADNTFCAGTSVTFTATGGTSYDFRIDGTSVQSGAVSTYSSNALTNGQIINVIVSDGTCSVLTSDIINTVNSISATIASSDPDNTFCAGTGVTFTATGGTSYDFRVNSVSVQLGAVATYSTSALTNGQTVDVIVSDGTCSATSAGIINTVNAIPTATLSSSDADNTFCAGTSVTFTATGGTSYDFRVNSVSAQIGVSATYTTNALTNGQTVEVIVSDGTCSVASAGITNTVNNLPIATLSSSDADNTFCAGTNITFTASGGTNFDFRVNGASVQNSASSTYSSSTLTDGQAVDVLVSDGTCSAASTVITNTVYPILPVSVTINANANPVCTDASVIFTATPVNGGTTPSYQWYNGATAVGSDSPTYSFVPSDGDVITVVLASSEACTSDNPATSNSVTVAVNSAVTVTAVPTNILCGGSVTGEINITPAGGSAPYTFAWTGTGVNASSEDQTNLAAGTYIVTVTDAANCSAAPLSVVLTENSPVAGSIIAQTNNVVFGASNGRVEVAGSGGMAPYQYRIGAGALQASGVFTALPAGDYTVTVQDVNNCSNVVLVTITQPSAALSVNVIDQIDIKCFGNTTGSVNVEGAGGMSPYQYRIDGGVWQTSGAFGSLGAGNHNVEVMDAATTIASLSVTLLTPAEAIGGIVVSQSPVLCFGGNTGSVTVAGSGGIGPYMYGVDGGPYQASATFNLTAGTHIVNIIDNNLCVYTINLVTEGPASSLAGAITDQRNISCNGAANGSVTVSGSGGTAPYQYSSGGGEFQLSGTFNNLPRGNHDITVRDANNCTIIVPALIIEPDALLATESHVDVLCPEDANGSISLSISGGTQPYNVIWADGATGANRTEIKDGDYSAVITDLNSCATSINVIVGVIGSEACLEIPVIITPNGDGYNDTWKIRNIDMFPDAEVVVFNRWGKKVFESRNVLASPWDGTFKGTLLPTDSYHYILDLKNGSKPRTGVISIIK